MNIQEKIISSINDSISTKQSLLQHNSNLIEQIGLVLAQQVKKGNKILFCGNGGSAADSQHLAAELVVRLRSNFNRPAIPGLALSVDTSILTAGGNDIGFDNIFARGVEAFGLKGDVLIGISTSGKSESVVRAILAAKEKGIITVGLLGGDGGLINSIVDHSLIIPSSVTARIQESHILVGHIWCEIIEEYCFGEITALETL